jgi:hypothetical protein
MAPKPKRRPLKPVSEAIRNWAQALAGEAETWPGTTLKSAFGMTLVYRKGVVFAALPKTRALYEEDGILLKFMSEPADLAARIRAEKRFAAGTMEQKRTRKGRPGGEGRRWRIFLMREDADVHAAIEWLAEAYRVAGKVSRPGR